MTSRQGHDVEMTSRQRHHANGINHAGDVARRLRRVDDHHRLDVVTATTLCRRHHPGDHPVLLDARQASSLSRADLPRRALPAKRQSACREGESIGNSISLRRSRSQSAAALPLQTRCCCCCCCCVAQPVRLQFPISSPLITDHFLPVSTSNAHATAICMPQKKRKRNGMDIDGGWSAVSLKHSLQFPLSTASSFPLAQPPVCLKHILQFALSTASSLP